MKNAWAVGTITDEFIATSKQLGVKNIIHYGGPGQTDWIGRGRTYEEYKEIVDTLKSNGLNLASFEGGFVEILIIGTFLQVVRKEMSK